MKQEVQSKINSLIERIDNLRNCGYLSEVEEGLMRLENQVKTINVLNEKIPAEKILAILEEMGKVLNELERYTRHNKRLAENEKGKWRLK